MYFYKHIYIYIYHDVISKCITNELITMNDLLFSTHNKFNKHSFRFIECENKYRIIF